MASSSDTQSVSDENGTSSGPSSDTYSSDLSTNEPTGSSLFSLPDIPAELPADLPSPPFPSDLDVYIPSFTTESEFELASLFQANPVCPTTTPDPFALSSQLQTYQSTTFTFPDDHQLQVPELTLLNAAVKVAQRLNVVDLIWDMTAISPFYAVPSKQTGNPMIDLTRLPSHLQPTPSQRLIPHHPVLDLLPWPATRDKLIQVFNLPVEVRPKSAQDSMGVVRLVYDMEDPAGEGMRVTGEDPLEVKGWEIGQVLFERWWWAFDGVVVEGSNSHRKKRGQERLILG